MKNKLKLTVFRVSTDVSGELWKYEKFIEAYMCEICFVLGLDESRHN